MEGFFAGNCETVREFIDQEERDAIGLDDQQFCTYLKDAIFPSYGRWKDSTIACASS